jgi:serine/threonine protein kinase
MEPTLAKGEILNERYEIVAVLGSGDFGVVYQARDLQDSGSTPQVAVKQMPMQCIVECERQADVRAALKHPAIPRILGYFSTEKDAFLVLELIAGWNLEVVLENQAGFLPEKVVLDWAIQLCDFLDYLHNHPHFPMIFRDMKPSNVMVDRKSKVHVVDFGLAKVFPPGFFANPTADLEYLWKGLSVGTEGYAPPEQYDGVVKPQSDIFALGATLYHLLTRRDPRKNPAFTFDKYPVRALNPAITDGFAAVVTRALNLEIERRYATAKEMRLALEALVR